MTSTASLRLRDTLGFWEALWFLEEMRYRTGEFNNHDQKEAFDQAVAFFAKWRGFRNLVLDQKVRGLDIADWYMRTPSSPELQPIMPFPTELFSWNRKSRRVYELPSDLTDTLVNASYSNIRWSDVVFPFDSFVVHTEKPLRIQDNAVEAVSEYDTVLVTKTYPNGEAAPDEWWWSVRLFKRPQHEDRNWCISPSAVGEVDRLISRQRYGVALREAQKLFAPVSRRYDGLHQGSILQPILWHEDPLDSFVKIEADELKLMVVPKSTTPQLVSWAAKLAVGLCLSLGRISSSAQWQSPNLNVGRKRPATGGVAAITDVEQVCSLVGKGYLDLLTKANDTGRRGEGFLRPHWRAQHMRRPPGSSPDAEKTVKIPAVLVRSDLVPKYGIIGGTATTVKA